MEAFWFFNNISMRRKQEIAKKVHSFSGGLEAKKVGANFLIFVLRKVFSRFCKGYFDG